MSERVRPDPWNQAPEVTPTQRRADFWEPYIPQTHWDNSPDDGHAHDYKSIAPVSLGPWGPLCIACVHCGWLKSWGDA